ncbi:MAG: SUMF1/EgtB/PvdO family nonheme iron enzyme [Candidatus Omnitrophota bacterium]
MAERLLFKGVFVLIIISIAVFALEQNGYAHNLRVSNVSLTSQDSVNSTIAVKYDIAWSNSWRNNINYDAVWVFVKYSADAGFTWRHATLKSAGANPSGFSRGYGTNIDIVVPGDKKGCFIQRSAVGVGEVDAYNIQLIWDWATDGLSGASSVRVKVFGIEMVYVPSGSFYIGDGNGGSESAGAFHVGGGNSAAQVTTSLTANIRVDANSYDDSQLENNGIGIDGDNGLDTDNNGVVDNAAFPTGYNAFYCMKYEISEGQWISFFNTLNNLEKIKRDITASGGKNSDAVLNRNTVSWSSGDAVSSREDRACTYFSWMDLCAFSDWACLRPMSELEFEKAARGSISSNYSEYAWGNTTVTSATTISGLENGTETITNSGANCNYNNEAFTNGDGGTGPLRVGIFATADSRRIDAGAGYYGAMELSGNVWERVVSVGNVTGRSFSATHGDGVLESVLGYEGNATNNDWPGYSAGQGISGAAGSGSRGGSWLEITPAKMSISDRSEASLTAAGRAQDTGGRCVRTAP